ncbi:MAG: Acetolactate synthase large subunit IlvG [Acidimicrobiales bacterium]|nr:MAG: thiamine pyrophosphate-binding protein [Actinomycetota bacterium]MBV6507545.1 Acetolactate synthase large subunit IlvG [Acidimicrobiales bacterium]RIK07485.1 MAG: benzaldehyde lyase [Acidobacteriota bacterium]
MPDFLPAGGGADEGGAQGPDVSYRTGGHMLAGALKDHGVDTIFTLCGGHILPLLDGCLDAGIRVIDHRHEGAAALAAEGWALATGEVGFAAVTAGPGFANAVIGLVDAGSWSVPLVLCAGHTGLAMTGRGAVQDADQMAIASVVAKRSLVCLETGRVEELAADALYQARAGRPGPVYLEMPQDVLAGKGPAGSPLHGHPAVPPTPAGAPEDVERALGLLQGADKPVILAGGGAFWSGAGESLLRLAEVAGIPVTTTSAARGIVPDSHELCLGTMVHGGGAVLGADVVLVLGSEFNANVSMGRQPLFDDGQTVIQVDIRPEGIGGNRRPDHAVVGDVKRVLDALADGWSGSARDREAWLGEATDLTAWVKSTWDDQVEAHRGSRIHPGAAARATVEWARSRLGPGVSFVADGGDALAWGLAYMYAEGPGRLLNTTTALGTLGVGVPFALAAQAARPDERTVLFVGDGAFGLSAMEFDTAVRHGLPVICVVSNNYGWRDVSFEQDAWFGAGRHVASELADSRYDLFAEAFGGHGEHVSEPDELEPALDRCLESGTASIVNVETDPTVLSDLLKNLGAMGIQ